MRTCFTYSEDWTTGLHLGIARSAVLNCMMARKHNGAFVVCCDSVPRRNYYTSYYLDQLNWLGVSPDEGVYHSSHFEDESDKVVRHLLKIGRAYVDYATPQEIHEEHKNSENSTFLYSRRFSEGTVSENSNRNAVIRLKMPRELPDQTYLHYMVVYDRVRGYQRFELHHEHDVVIKYSDGRYSPYLTRVLAYRRHNIDLVVTDQSNLQALPAMLFLANCLNYKIPEFAHLPYLLDPVGQRRFSIRNKEQHDKDDKFSDLYRRGIRINEEISDIGGCSTFYPCYVDFYKRTGFSPEAIQHYLIASAQNDPAIVADDSITGIKQCSELFNWNQASVSQNFDTTLLLKLQKRYFEKQTFESKVWLINEFLREVGLSKHWPLTVIGKPIPQELKSLVEGLDSKMEIAGDILSLKDYFDNDLRLLPSN